MPGRDACHRDTPCQPLPGIPAPLGEAMDALVARHNARGQEPAPHPPAVRKDDGAVARPVLHPQSRTRALSPLPTRALVPRFETALGTHAARCASDRPAKHVVQRKTPSFSDTHSSVQLPTAASSTPVAAAAVEPSSPHVLRRTLQHGLGPRLVWSICIVIFFILIRLLPRSCNIRLLLDVFQCTASPVPNGCSPDRLLPDFSPLSQSCFTRRLKLDVD